MKTKFALIFVSISVIFSLIMVIALFFIKFHNGLSSMISDWAAFGSYIGGVVTPILTIINIVIFTWLTLVIKDSGEDQKKKELEYQRKLLMANFRQAELNKLQSILEEVIDTTNENRADAAYKARRYLTNMRFPQGNVFTLTPPDNLQIDYDYLVELIDKIIDFYNNEKSTEDIKSALDNYYLMVVITRVSIQRLIIEGLS